MNRLAALLCVALSACETWMRTGSLYRSQCLHVGVRPAAELDGAAVTVQVSTDIPCRKVTH